ncbi:MAG: hypothetical protein JNL58_06335 [Planctomyces sp.]|nr:hypothetical protein [Planctomyces sp.]
MKISAATNTECPEAATRETAAAVWEYVRAVRSFWYVLLFGICGCMNPENTRMPQCMSYFPQAENRAFQRQNPFSDPDIGPSTDFAPRGYDRPRSEAQRAAEERTLRGLPVGPESINPGLPTGSRSHSRSVY